ncbi:MAG TPA: hypothetical protein VEZ70_05030 [Allosphingosinicella sp.]|nr:hypothetical protein [Allosphingosinicella sp.]
MIRVVLVDDQTLVRQGVRGLLDLVPDIQVWAKLATARKRWRWYLSSGPTYSSSTSACPG